MLRMIETVCVIGAGYMGNQIALQCAAFGKQVSQHDVSETALQASAQVCGQTVAEMIEAGVVPHERRAEILDSIRRTTTVREAVEGVQLVIEAINENVVAKRGVFHQLDQLCSPDTILATNSSSIRISRIESATRRKDRMLNTHFVTPVWKHPFVELMGGTATSDETFTAVRGFMSSIGILPLLVRKESTGFLFNRIWRAVKKEALKVVDEGIATVEDVDRAWMIQWETPLGPFALMDSVGLDVVRDIELVYFEQSGDPTDAPPQVLLDKISKGELGVKSGRGFYNYPNPAWQSPEFLKQASQ